MSAVMTSIYGKLIKKSMGKMGELRLLNKLRATTEHYCRRKKVDELYSNQYFVPYVPFCCKPGINTCFYFVSLY